MPRRCPRLASQYMPDRKYRSLIFAKRYLIIYQIAESNVYIDYILDCRHDYGWLFNERIAMPFGKTDKKAS